MNWHPTLRRAALFAVALALAGCAGPPTFRGFLKERYPGYDQILPAATALPNEPGFDYLPGNILALTLEKRGTLRQSALWNNIGIFCPTNVPLVGIHAGKSQIDQGRLRFRPLVAQNPGIVEAEGQPSARTE